MTDILGVDASRIAFVMLALGLAGAVGSRLGGFGVDRWGEKRVMIISALAHAAALTLLPLAADSIPFGLGLVAIVMLSINTC